MLVHLRRSVITCPHLPGLLRLRLRLRRHRGRPAALQAPGRRVDHRQRLHPHRPELGRHHVPGHPMGSCVFHGRPDDTGPYAADPKQARRPAATTRSSPTASAASRAPPTWAGPRSCSPTPSSWSPTGTPWASTPDPGPGHHLGQRLRPRHHPPGRHRPDPDGGQGHRDRPLRPAGPHQQADPQRPAGLPRQQLHRRPAAQRGPRQTALSRPAGERAARAMGEHRPPTWLPSAYSKAWKPTDRRRSTQALAARRIDEDATDVVEAAGHFRIYLGAAAGVGKTYAMLNEGHRRKQRGTDVVIGFVESHGRPLTEELSDDLEIVPRRVDRVPGHPVRGDGPRRRAGPPARRSPSSTSSPTPTCPDRAPREALGGRPRASSMPAST